MKSLAAAMCSAIGDETLAGVFNGDDESETIGDGDGKKKENP